MEVAQCRIHHCKFWLNKLQELEHAIPSNNIKGAPQLNSRAAALALRARGVDLHDGLGARHCPAMSLARLQWAKRETENGHRMRGAQGHEIG